MVEGEAVNIKFSPKQISLLASFEAIVTLEVAPGSKTVTVAGAVLEIPLASVTVSTTLFTPTFVQSNTLISVSKIKPPQESEDPSLTASSAIVTLPNASSWTVIFLVITFGAVVS